MTQTDDVTNAPFEVQDEGGTSDRRRLAVIGVVAAVVLAAAGWFLIGGGGGDSSDDASAVPSARHKIAPAAGAPAAAKPATVLPAASTVKLGRDPFHPLYVVPAEPVAADPNAAGSGTTTGGATSGGTSTPAPTKPTTTTSTYALRLSRVDGSGSNLTAQFLVGAAKRIQYARAGSVFGRSLEIRLLSLQKGSNGSGTAVIQVGDGSPFDVSTSDAAVYVL